MAVLLLLAKTRCINSFSSNYRFCIRPNTVTVDSHLSQNEIELHDHLLKTVDKYLTDQEVIALLWKNNKVPLWINASILKSSDKWTTIELVTSRRLRTENELNHVADQFPPFHIQIPLPPFPVDGNKFDINLRTLT